MAIFRVRKSRISGRGGRNKAYFGTYAYFEKITPFLTHPPQNQKNGLKVACYFAKNTLKKGHPPLKLTVIIMNQQNLHDKNDMSTYMIQQFSKT